MRGVDQKSKNENVGKDTDSEGDEKCKISKAIQQSLFD
jgi:hypothetical protein